MAIKNPEIKMILAQTEDNIIGDAATNGMPWRSSIDFKWFQKHTMTWPCIFGSTTAKNMPQFPLKNRPCATLTSRRETEVVPAAFKHGTYLSFGPGGFYNSLGEALRFFQNYDKVFLCGGATLYRHGLQATKPWWNDAAKRPMIDKIIKTVFPAGIIKVENPVRLDDMTVSMMSAPNFQLVKSLEYILEGDAKGQEYWPQGKTYDEIADAPVFPLKETDTPFPWIRFEVWQRAVHNLGK